MVGKLGIFHDKTGCDVALPVRRVPARLDRVDVCERFGRLGNRVRLYLTGPRWGGMSFATSHMTRGLRNPL